MFLCIALHGTGFGFLIVPPCLRLLAVNASHPDCIVHRHMPPRHALSASVGPVHDTAASLSDLAPRYQELRSDPVAALLRGGTSEPATHLSYTKSKKPSTGFEPQIGASSCPAFVRSTLPTSS